MLLEIGNFKILQIWYLENNDHEDQCLDDPIVKTLHTATAQLRSLCRGKPHCNILLN